MKLTTVPAPPGEWLRRLRPQDCIRLVKEHANAVVSFPWVPPRPGQQCGELVFRQLSWRNELCGPQIWYIDGFGRGFDGSALVLPCAGYLGETAATEQITGTMALLVDSCVSRLASAERYLDMLSKENAELLLKCNLLTARHEDLLARVAELQQHYAPLITEVPRERSIDLTRN